MLSEIRIKKRFRYKTTESFDDTLQKVSRVSRGVLICQRLHGIDFLGHEMGYHQKLLAVVTEKKNNRTYNHPLIKAERKINDDAEKGRI